MCGEKNFAQKMFIFAQFLEKFAQKQNVPKFWKNLPNFQKLPNTCSPAKGTLARSSREKALFDKLIMLADDYTSHPPPREKATGEKKWV